MRRVIGPYVFEGGGAKSLNKNFQSLARDLTQATLEIPFSIPPYFALVARALGTTRCPANEALPVGLIRTPVLLCRVRQACSKASP
jgi:hypothetical protein